jgi:F-type H+-transporting ATPase subunit delta
MKANRRARLAARQLFRLCQVEGRLVDDRVRRVVNHAVASRHRHALAILGQFERLVRLAIQKRTAVVESAEPLPDDVRALILEHLTRRYGPDLTTSFSHTPALIGGTRIAVGSDVYDSSIRARLSALLARL